MTLAVGGAWTVPEPDPIARDYILLALRLDQRIPGLVDGYFGPADLKAQVDLDQLPASDRLRDDAATLRTRLASEVADPARRRWLEAQCVALETQARAIANDPLPYLDHVRACFDFMPSRTDETVFAAAAEELERLLPGQGPLAERIAARDAGLTVDPARLPPVIDWVVAHFRDRAAALFGLPPGESVRVSLVKNQPWSGYNWYDGGGRSRVDLNTDLPIRAVDLLSVLAHETYFGHHLEHAAREVALVQEAGALEASVLTINTPECLISEGLADLGRQFAVPASEEVDLLVEVYRRAGLPVAADPAVARAEAERQVSITRALADVRGVAGNAALLLHADRAPRAEVLAYLERWLITTPQRAAKRLEFIEHPLWRTYVFVYFEGERLLRGWLEQVPEADQPARYARLLREPLTPGSIVAEIAAGERA